MIRLYLMDFRTDYPWNEEGEQCARRFGKMLYKIVTCVGGRLKCDDKRIG